MNTYGLKSIHPKHRIKIAHKVKLCWEHYCNLRWHCDNVGFKTPVTTIPRFWKQCCNLAGEAEGERGISEVISQILPLWLRSSGRSVLPNCFSGSLGVTVLIQLGPCWFSGVLADDWRPCWFGWIFVDSAISLLIQCGVLLLNDRFPSNQNLASLEPNFS